jgi:LysM repeat protein
MKSKTLPVKRRPASKGIFRRLSAVTFNRKQRVSASATGAAMEADDGSSKISRALIIIFLIHIVAIGMIFIHQRFLNGRHAERPETVQSSKEEVATAAPAVPQLQNLPRAASGEKPYIVRTGDDYARIAVTEGVDEGALRLINKHVSITPGLILKIPPKRMLADEPPVVTATRKPTPAEPETKLVDAVPVDVGGAPKARPVSIQATPDTTARTASPRVEASGKSYVVQPGDSIWRIAHRFKISQDALMRANGISDPRKMKTGMKLVIPQT